MELAGAWGAGGGGGPIAGAAAALEAAGEREAAPAPISPVRASGFAIPTPPLLCGAFDRWSPPPPSISSTATSATPRPRVAPTWRPLRCTRVLLCYSCKKPNLLQTPANWFSGYIIYIIILWQMKCVCFTLSGPGNAISPNLSCNMLTPKSQPCNLANQNQKLWPP